FPRSALLFRYASVIPNQELQLPSSIPRLKGLRKAPGKRGMELDGNCAWSALTANCGSQSSAIGNGLFPPLIIGGSRAVSSLWNFGPSQSYSREFAHVYVFPRKRLPRERAHHL